MGKTRKEIKRPSSHKKQPGKNEHRSTGQAIRKLEEEFEAYAELIRTLTDDKLKEEFLVYERLSDSNSLSGPMDSAKLIFGFLDPVQRKRQIIDEEIRRRKVEARTTPTGKRLKLSPNDRELLNNNIVRRVREFIEYGKGTQNEAFQNLSKESMKIFKFRLSPKQIEGRYNRHKKEVRD